MNILMFLDGDASKGSSLGVHKKIRAIRKVLSQFGNTDLLYRKGKYIILNDKKIVCKLNSNNKFFKQVSSGKSFYEVALQDHYDMLYYRMGPSLSHIYVLCLFRKFKGIKIVEIPTNSSVAFYEIIKSRYSFLSKLLSIIDLVFFWWLILRYADIVLVAVELGFMEKIYRDKVIIFTNGIDLDDLPPIRKESSIEKIQHKINLIGVAKITFWQGYDRVIKGLAEYYENKSERDPEVYFHVVGEGPDLPKLKRLSRELNVEKYVIFEGVKSGEDLFELYRKADIGVGSLGNHRKGHVTPSSLKHVEYCAFGIPIILQKEINFNADFPYIFSVSENDEPIPIKSILGWYYSITRNYPEYWKEMRKYAEMNLTWSVKLKPLVEKIKKIATQKVV